MNATTYDELVLQLQTAEGKAQTIAELRAAGEDAKPALLRGLKHPAWRARHGCLQVLDHTIVDDPTRVAVLKALEDPHRKVRRAALHVLGCEACKPEGYCGIEGVDLEAVVLEVARKDASKSMRRRAINAFMWRSSLDEDVADAMRHLLYTDESDEIRERAAHVLAYPAIGGAPKTAERRARFRETVEALLKA